MLPALPLLLRDPVLPMTAPAAEDPVISPPPSSSSETQRSHRSQPTNVAKLLQLTTDTGETRSCEMATKQTRKMMTEQTCWRMTVESETRGQKS